jgi:hypothetical protein
MRGNAYRNGISCTVKGSFKKTDSFLRRALKIDFDSVLQRYAEIGLNALISATPVRTGKTAASWYYEISKTEGQYRLVYKNSNRVKNNCIAIILDYGHANGHGRWIEGRHFIEPAIQPVFDQIVEKAWKILIKEERPGE